jgi:RNAse (barnase) inhibitor barstar
MPLYAQIERILNARSAALELSSDLPVADIVSALELEGCRVAILDRAPVFDKDTLLHALYQGCGFPAYFGFNWDALSDALVEKIGEESRPLILIFQDFDLLGARAPDVAQTFLDIFDEVADLTEGTLVRLVCLKR